jgi:hypothetical protein
VTPQSLINECRLAGVLVNLDGGVLKLKGAPDAVRIAADRLRPFKAEIVRYQMDLMATPVTDLARGFMDDDGVTLAEAEALAAISVQPRPTGEWLAMITELDALIGTYCAAEVGMTDKNKTAIRGARLTQSLASIPETLEWFRGEVAHIMNKLPQGELQTTKGPNITEATRHKLL